MTLPKTPRPEWVEAMARTADPFLWVKIDRYANDDDWNGATAINAKAVMFDNARAAYTALRNTMMETTDVRDIDHPDARLILAAPDLLEAAIALERAEDAWANCPLPSMQGDYSEFLVRFFSWWNGEAQAALRAAQETDDV